VGAFCGAVWLSFISWMLNGQVAFGAALARSGRGFSSYVVCLSGLLVCSRLSAFWRYPFYCLSPDDRFLGGFAWICRIIYLSIIKTSFRNENIFPPIQVASGRFSGYRSWGQRWLHA
jgi:hypothetical protein